MLYLTWVGYYFVLLSLCHWVYYFLTFYTSSVLQHIINHNKISIPTQIINKPPFEGGLINNAIIYYYIITIILCLVLLYHRGMVFFYHRGMVYYYHRVYFVIYIVWCFCTIGYTLYMCILITIFGYRVTSVIKIILAVKSDYRYYLPM